MVVGVIKGQENFATKITTRIIKKIKTGDYNSTFVFETIDQKPVPNFSNFFKDLSYFGRHYLIAASSDDVVLRQYTVCNTFIPEFYSEIFKLIEDVLAGRKPDFDMSLLEDRPSSRVHMTLKNYKQPKGLSAKIHAQKVNEGKNEHTIQHVEDSVVEEKDALTLFKATAPKLERADTIK